MGIGEFANVFPSESEYIALAAAVAAAASAVVAMVTLVVTVWRDIIRDRPKLIAEAHFSPSANTDGGLLLNLSAVNSGRRPISVIGWIVLSRKKRYMVPSSGFFLKEAETWSHNTEAGDEFGPKDVIDIFCSDTTGKEWHVPKRNLKKLETNLLLFTNFICQAHPIKR